MERPQLTLILLIFVGLGLGGFFYGAHEKTILAKQHKKDLAAQKQELENQIEQLQSGSGSPGAGDAPTTNDLLPPTDADTSEERLQEQVTFLEEQLDLLRDENARLLQLVDRLETKLKSAGTGSGEKRSFSGEEEKALVTTQDAHFQEPRA